MQRSTSRNVRGDGAASPIRLHAGTGASPSKQAPTTLPQIDGVTPAIIHWDGPCTCVVGGELCEHCKRRGHPLADTARSVHWDGSPQRYASPSPVPRALAESPVVSLGEGAAFPMDGIVAFAPFRAEIEKLNAVVDQAEEKLQINLVNRVVERSCKLMDRVCLPVLQLEEKQRLVEKNGKECVKLLKQREAKSGHVRRRATAQVMKLVDQFASELASRANSEYEDERAQEIHKREKVAKQLRYKLDHSHYDVESQVHQHVASIQAEANGRVAERDAELQQRDETIARLQRELAVAQTLNSKLVERENLAAERIAREAVTAIKKPFVPAGGFNPELEPTSAESVAASEALLAAAGDPAAAAVAPPPPPLSS